MQLTSYQIAIRDLDSTINPVGVECSMRLQVGNLSMLYPALFREELRIAGECEKASPGYLRGLAEIYGKLEQFEEWEREQAERIMERIGRAAQVAANPEACPECEEGAVRSGDGNLYCRGCGVIPVLYDCMCDPAKRERYRVLNEQYLSQDTEGRDNG